MNSGSGDSALTALPVEIIEHIFCYLSPLDVVKCRQVCRLLCRVIDSSIELLLRVELVIDGYLLESRGQLPANILLQRIRERRRALEELDPNWFWKIQRASSDVHRYEINSGIFGHGINQFNPEHFRGVRYRHLLPPSLHVADHSWEDVGFRLADLSFDFSEDLQVLVEQTADRKQRRLIFNTISTNVPHPRAGSPIVVLRESDFALWESCSTLLYGDYLAVGFSQWDRNDTQIEGCQMVINWKTGDVSLQPTETLDLAFLTGDLVLLLAGRDPIYLGIYDLTKRTYIGRFALPFTLPLTSAFFLTHPPYKPTSVSPAISEKFVPDPALGIIGMLFIPSWGDHSDIYVVLSRKKFLSKALMLCQTLPQQECFAWEDWGPDVTRWFPSYMIQDVGFRGVFGSRMIAKGDLSPWPMNETDPPDSLVLFDFNPRTILRGSCGETSNGFKRIIVDEEWTWSHPLDPSRVVVQSRLPFRATACIKPLRHRYEDIYLDMNTIVGRMADEYHLLSFLPRLEND